MTPAGRPGGLSQGEAVLARLVRLYGGVLPRAMTIRDHHALFGAAADLIEFVPQGLPEPTQAPPGSAEKIAVLRARLAAGLELWHPDDLVIDSPLAAFEAALARPAPLPSDPDWPVVCAYCGRRIINRLKRRYCSRACMNRARRS